MLKDWKHGSIGKYVLKDKMILGHESSGIISAVGSGVRDLKAGDKVAMEPGEVSSSLHLADRV